MGVKIDTVLIYAASGLDTIWNASNPGEFSCPTQYNLTFSINVQALNLLNFLKASLIIILKARKIERFKIGIVLLLMPFLFPTPNYQMWRSASILIK